jgi:ATP-dependent Clp protease ATP-binding subunit ClpA
MDLITEKGYDNEYGARPLKRVIQRYIEDRLSEEILRGNLKENSVLTIDTDGENFVFNNSKAKSGHKKTPPKRCFLINN